MSVASSFFFMSLFTSSKGSSAGRISERMTRPGVVSTIAPSIRTWIFSCRPTTSWSNARRTASRSG